MRHHKKEKQTKTSRPVLQEELRGLSHEKQLKFIQKNKTEAIFIKQMKRLCKVCRVAIKICFAFASRTYSFINMHATFELNIDLTSVSRWKVKDSKSVLIFILWCSFWDISVTSKLTFDLDPNLKVKGQQFQICIDFTSRMYSLLDMHVTFALNFDLDRWPWPRCQGERSTIPNLYWFCFYEV